MLTLAVDTAGEHGSIALLDVGGEDGDRLLEEIGLHSPGGFGQSLLGEIEALLGRHNVRLADIGFYAASTGPGSFTGVRIGLAAIKGFAEVAEKPAIGISSLEALAECGTAALRAPVIDAKRGEIYAAVFDQAGSAVVPAMVAPLTAFHALVGDRPVEWISADFEMENVTRAPRELAAAIGLLAIRKLRAGAVSDPAAIEADYVRRPDAEIFWKE